MASRGDATTLIQWRLLGSRNWLNGRFQAAFAKLGYDRRWQVAYQDVLDEVTDQYMNEVMDRWRAEHDRTGETLDTFRSTFRTPTTFEATKAIVVGGNVGFVINPLPTHVIGGPGQALAGPDPYSPHYSEFGPRFGPITWFQGGPESRNPDMTWFQDPAEALAGLGQAGLRHVAGVVREEVLGLTAVDGELTSGMVEMHWDL